MGLLKKAIKAGVRRIRRETGPVLPRLEEGIAILHEVLKTSSLDGKYWINGGLILGYAREGGPLSHDPDVDFSFWNEDRPALLEAIEKLVEAGFRKKYCWKNNAGEATEWSLRYRGVPFEFFAMYPVDNKIQWYCYGDDKEQVCQELVCQVPVHGLEDFEMFGLTWKKPDDHETYLEALYGDWRVPDPNYYHVTDSQAIISRKPWKGNHKW